MPGVALAHQVRATARAGRTEQPELPGVADAGAARGGHPRDVGDAVDRVISGGFACRRAGRTGVRLLNPWRRRSVADSQAEGRPTPALVRVVRPSRGSG